MLIKEFGTGEVFSFFAHDDSCRPIGFALVTLEGKNLNLDSLTVFPFQQGRGYGRQLLKRAIEWGREKGAIQLSGEFVPQPGYETASRKLYDSTGITIDDNGKLFKKLG